MFLMMTRVPPALVAVTIALAHLAVLFDIAIRRDLPWWRRLGTAVIVGVLLPLGALVYLVVRPSVAEWISESRVGAHPRCEGRLTRSGWRTLAGVGSVAGLRLPWLPAVVPALPRDHVTAVAGQDYGVACSTCRSPGNPGTGDRGHAQHVDSEFDPVQFSFLAPGSPGVPSPTGRARPTMACRTRHPCGGNRSR